MKSKLIIILLILSLLPFQTAADMYEDDDGNYRIENESNIVIWYQTYGNYAVGIGYCHNVTLRECIISGDYGLSIGGQSTNITIWNTSISSDLYLFPHTSTTIINPDVGGRIIQDHDNASLTTLYTVNFYNLPDGAVVHGNGSGLYEMGEYNYSITCDGYYDYNGSFNISDGPMELSPQLTPIPPPNEPPVAIAGENRTVPLGYDLLVTGSKSTDDKGIVKYQWIFDNNGTTINKKWWIYHCDMVGNYTLTLWVGDAEGLSDTDNMTVNVYDPNPPVINDTGPVINDTQPHLNDTTPHINDTGPVINDTIPSINDTEPVINDTEPHINDIKTDTLNHDTSNSTYYPDSTPTKTNVASADNKEAASPWLTVFIVLLALIIVVVLLLFALLRRKPPVHAPPKEVDVIVPDEVIKPEKRSNMR